MITRGTETSELSEYDVCIVGSGPAGMAACAELSTSGLRILVVESGTDDKSAFADSLRHIECTGIGIRENSRERILGGASETWGGMSAPLDPIDYEKRPYAHEHEGWPLSPAEIAPHLERAGERYRFAMPEEFEPERFLTEEEKKDVPWTSLEPKTFLAVRPPFQFGKELRYLFSRPNIDLISGITVTELVPDHSGKKVASAVCRGADGTHVEVQAKEFILATAAIENARILLNSKRASPSGIGNEHDQVGRYFMNHPKGYLGRVELRKIFPTGRAYFWKKYRGYSGYIGLRLREDIQRSKKMLNAYVRLEEGFPWTNRKEMAVIKKSLAHAKAFVSAIVRARGGALKEITALGKLLPQLIISLPGYAGLTFSRLSRIRKPYPTHLLPRYFLEMEPRSTNRITLSRQVDAFGMPIPRVHHEPSELDISSFRELQGTLARECEELGIGTLTPEEIRTPNEDASHHLGSTRMGRDPRTSVVDPNLRVHSMENLYIAGGSVFPTSGCANSTLMMVALSVRLAEYLREKVFHVPTEASQTLDPSVRPVIIIGAGRRVRNDILPVLESLPKLFAIRRIYARSARAIFGKERVYEVGRLSTLDPTDIAKAKVLYLSIPSGEVQAVINSLSAYDCSHLDLILPTPVSPDLVISPKAFKRVVVEEDCAFLPWILAFKRASKKIGALKSITLDRSAYKYHATALMKVLMGNTQLMRRFRFGKRTFYRSGEMRATLIEPRDYDTGRMTLVCEHGRITDRPAAGALDIRLFADGQGLCKGLGIGKETEHLLPEETKLFGAVKKGDTVITRMHDCKRVGLRRLLQSLEDEQSNPWPLEEGKSDVILAGRITS